MNLAEDYFLKKYFPEEFLSQNSEKLKTDATVLFFTEVFRRHHVQNDPINNFDQSGQWDFFKWWVCMAESFAPVVDPELLIVAGCYQVFKGDPPLALACIAAAGVAAAPSTLTLAAYCAIQAEDPDPVPPPPPVPHPTCEPDKPTD